MIAAIDSGAPIWHQRPHSDTAAQLLDFSLVISAATMADVGIDTLDVWVTKLMDCTPLTEHEVKQLCDKAREVLIEESNVQPVRAPVRTTGWLLTSSV